MIVRFKESGQICTEGGFALKMGLKKEEAPPQKEGANKYCNFCLARKKNKNSSNTYKFCNFCLARYRSAVSDDNDPSKFT